MSEHIQATRNPWLWGTAAALAVISLAAVFLTNWAIALAALAMIVAAFSLPSESAKEPDTPEVVGMRAERERLLSRRRELRQEWIENTRDERMELRRKRMELGAECRRLKDEIRQVEEECRKWQARISDLQKRTTTERKQCWTPPRRRKRSLSPRVDGM